LLFVVVSSSSVVQPQQQQQQHQLLLLIQLTLQHPTTNTTTIMLTSAIKKRKPVVTPLSQQQQQQPRLIFDTPIRIGSSDEHSSAEELFIFSPFGLCCRKCPKQVQVQLQEQPIRQHLQSIIWIVGWLLSAPFLKSTQGNVTSFVREGHLTTIVSIMRRTLDILAYVAISFTGKTTHVVTAKNKAAT
jgi:hypothetical protein